MSSSELRKESLNKIKEREPYSVIELFYEGQKQKFNVYKIDVTKLIFNKYNGRIGTYVKGYEKFNGTLDPTKSEDENIIINYLWKSNERRNKDTKKDIEAKEQLVPGIVSADGIIVDGNRRAMILKKMAQEKSYPTTHFIAAILPDTLDEKPKEIRRLETMVQMGEDAKVDYNPIEKYVKCKDLKEVDGFTDNQIAKMFGDETSKVQEYLDILDLMDDYLDNHLKSDDEEESSYSGMYTVLSEQKREGPFVDLNNHLNKHTSNKRVDRDWEPESEDINDVKSIAFDHIRAGIGSQQGIRSITNPAKDKGIFSKKNLYKKFEKDHFDIVDKIREKSVQKRIEENPTADATNIILARDEDFKKNIVIPLTTNLRRRTRELEDLVDEIKPYELLEAALQKVSQIEDDSDFSDNPDHALEVIKKINRILYGLQKPLEKMIK